MAYRCLCRVMRYSAGWSQPTSCPTNIMFLSCLVAFQFFTVVEAKGGGGLSSGGGGGGAGGGAGGGMYFGGGRRQDQSGGSSNPVIIGLSVAVVFGVLGGFFGLRYYLQQRWISTMKAARQTIIQEASDCKTKNATINIHRDLPSAFAFQAHYSDFAHAKGRIQMESTGTMELHPFHPSTNNLEKANLEKVVTQNCRCISGRGTDQDGEFKIVQGLVTSTGTCCWVEESLNIRLRCKQQQQQALVTGSFLTRNGKLYFEGAWKSNNGYHGMIEFPMMDASKEFPLK